MSVAQDQRPSFYQEQYLGPEDLTSTVEYGRIRLARHCLGAHTWGLAVGVQLIEKPSPAGNNQVDVFLTPGYAWDGFGRPIVVLAPYKIPAQLFQDIVYDASVDDPAKSGDSAAGHPVKIWLRYTESPNNPAALGFQACDASNQTSRVQESFGLEIGEIINAGDQRDPVSVGGQQMDAQQALIAFDPGAQQVYDGSIPQQALPDDDAQASWLIPVGYVRWLPGQTPNQAGAFQKRTAKDLAKSEAVRQYIGVVAGAIEAAGQNIQLKSRGAAPSGVLSDDFLWVEGKARIEGDLNLFGGKLSLLNSGGQDDGVPLFVQRTRQTDPNTLQILTSLQVEIGKDNAGNDMFQVGPADKNSGNFVPVFNVFDNGKAGVGTTKPRNALGVRGLGATQELLSFEDQAGTTVWHLNQNPGGSNSGLNVAETGVADFRLFIQAGGKVGIGTAAPSNRLHVDDTLGIRQRYLYLSGDKGWSSLTYNAYHDGQNQNWQFPDPSRPAVTIEMDDQSGAGGRFQVWGTTLAAKTQWIQRFGIEGESGNVFMAHQGGRVGIGTNNPQSLLDVAGRIQLNADGSIRTSRFNVTQVVSQQGPLTINQPFTSGGGTLLILASGSGWSGATGTIIGMSISVDGTFRGNAQSMTNEASSHKAFVAGALVVSGVPAGAHQLSLSAQANTHTDGNDFFAVTIVELPF